MKHQLFIIKILSKLWNYHAWSSNKLNMEGLHDNFMMREVLFTKLMAIDSQTSWKDYNIITYQYIGSYNIIVLDGETEGKTKKRPRNHIITS